MFLCFVLSDEIKVQAIDEEKEGNRQYRLKMHKTVLYTGFGIFALGVVLSSVSLVTIFVTGEGFYFPWSPIIILFGLGQMVIGLNVISGERKNNI